ncbi:MAG: dihydrofolate reductase [Bacillota bacterium]|nr:dihydrofolate reductase [Bacillota bacterium]
MKVIANANLNWGIGLNGKLLVWIPEDMKFFKKCTLGKVVVMGRETFETLPGKEPLKDRTNVVLTRNSSFEKEGIVKCSSIYDLKEKLKDYNSDDVYIIGGESIYKQLLPFCSEALITKVENNLEADKYFVNLDEKEEWELAEQSELKTYNDINFRFIKYINKTIKNT